MTQIQGELHPKVGFPTPYTLNIPEAYVVRWDVAAGTKSKEVLDTNKQIVNVTFHNHHAGKNFEIRAWYKMSEEQADPMYESVNVIPVFGEPHIITSSWQNTEGYDVTQCTLQDLYLTIRTTNIPPEAKIEVLLYDKERIGGNKYGGDFYGYVNTNGIAKIRITQSQWLKVRNQLYNKSNLGEDWQYQLYAKIRYTLGNSQAYDTNYPTVVESESPLLIMNNTESILAAQQRIDQSNKSAVISQPDDIGFTDSKKSITLKIRVYFDGTGGNMENVNKMVNVIEKHCGKAPDINDYSTEAYQEAYQRYLENLSTYPSITINREGGSGMQGTKPMPPNPEDYSQDAFERDWLNYQIKIGANKEAIEKDIDIDPTDDTKSYNQVSTNIPKMRKLDQDEKDDEKNGIWKAVVYVSGVGTNNLKSDDTYTGMGLGADYYNSGIPSKVKEAMAKIKGEVNKKKFNPEKEIIEQIEVAAFGFSRGAATTRSFVAERQMLADALSEVLQVKISTASIAYKLVGIFDTVCSVTPLEKEIPKLLSNNVLALYKIGTYILDSDAFLKLQKNNVRDYKLAMGSNIEKVIHLTAGDEYRTFFPLTDIDSSIRGGVGYELKLPGSHCDIGGGDLDIVYEKITEENKTDFIDKFVHPESGWYFPEDKKTETSSRMIPQGSFAQPLFIESKKYTVNRAVTVGYNRIPLRIMLHFIEDILKVKYVEKDLLKESQVQDDLLPLRDELLAFAISNYGNKRASAISVLDRPQFNGIRRKYLHLSASPENGQSGMVAIIKDGARRNKQGNSDRGIFNG